MKQFIFDTNFYRSRYHELKSITDFDEQIKIERINNFKVLFPTIVALELLNHFNDDDNISTICYESLKLLNKHSSVNGMSLIVPTMYPLLSFHLYQKKSKFDDLNENVFNLSQNANIKNLDDFKVEFNQYLVDISNYIIEEKKIIISNIEKNYIAELSQNYENPDWEILKKDTKLNKEFRQLIKDAKMHKIIGLGFINMAAEQTNSNLIPFDKDYFENTFLEQYKVSIDFYVENILKKLVDLPNLENFYNPESDRKKRWNSYYDMQLILATEFENSQNRETIFVTKENKIINSFKNNNKENLVLHYDDYFKLLQ